MQMMSKLCTTLSVLENEYDFVENRCSISTFGQLLSQEARTTRRWNALSQRVELWPLPSAWGQADPPLDFSVFPLS